MLVLLLILIPLLGGLASLFLSEKLSSTLALLSSIAVLVVSGIAYSNYSCTPKNLELLSMDHEWISVLGTRFSISLFDSVGMLMVLLTAIVFPLVFFSLRNKKLEKPNTFYGLMLLAQAGLMGVFLAKDAFLFYIFWELALIPVYFLSSMYGGSKRIAVTFKFFIYTFVGSLIMLVALILIYQQTPTHSFAWADFIEAGKSMSAANQSVIFWMMFVAFAIKMPIFPFHTWQPDAYEQSATPVTIVLSAIMVKMGLFAVVRWLMPTLPSASFEWMNVVLTMSIISIVYASCMAIVQTNIKRMIAYSSIAHIGLMCAAIFSNTELGMQGAFIQMFNHGITIMGLWIIVSIIEDRLGTQDLRELGGIAKVAPAFTIALVLISLANIALPLTNGFIGEFMMFNGLFHAASQYHIVFTVVAGIGIILAAVYTLNMIQKVAFGETNHATISFKDLATNELIVLILIVLMILILGIYPKCLMNLIYITK